MGYGGAVSAGIFSIRNVDKTSNGEVGRLPVAVGQISNTFKEIAKYNNIFARGVKGTLNTLDEIAKYDQICNNLSKCVKFASEHVNPLIVASSGLNVALADDKKSTAIAETGNLVGMFACEGMMKRHLDKIIDACPISGRWKPIVKGLVFVAGSIGGSMAGHAGGKKIAQEVKARDEEREQARLAETEDAQRAYTPLSYAA
ncbi:hypothetical protein IJ579_08085 [bacterium]|nr:hypothetical protein [bacterium]